MRSDAELIDFYRRWRVHDSQGALADELFRFLSPAALTRCIAEFPGDLAKSHAMDDLATGQPVVMYRQEGAVARLADYWGFARMKIIAVERFTDSDCRRSLLRLMVWLFILGDEALLTGAAVALESFPRDLGIWYTMQDKYIASFLNRRTGVTQPFTAKDESHPGYPLNKKP